MMTPTIVVAGPEQPEPECTVAPTGIHCWHPTGDYRLGEGGAYSVRTCCHCAALKYVPVLTYDPEKHGRHLPPLWWMRE